MTTLEIVDLLKGRPAGNNRWFARCPVHEEKSGSLSIRAGKKATLLYCFGCHAKSAQIMGALGYTAQDCFYDAGRKMTREQRDAFKARKRHEEAGKLLELRWSICLFAFWAYPTQRRAWVWMERRAWRALKWHDLEADPERKAAYLLAREIKRKGFDALWAELEASPEWPAMLAEVQR